VKTSIVAVCLLAGAALPAHASFVNAGFETGDFSGWTVGGPNGGSGVGADGTLVPAGLFQPAFVNVRTGEFAAYGATAAWNLEYLSLSQTVNLAPGRHVAGFWMGHDEPTLIGIDVAINLQQLAIFVDGALQPFTTRFPGNNFPNGSASADMYEFSSIFDHQGGAALIELRISGSGEGRSVLSVDDTFVTGVTTDVPEPASLALLGLGLAGLGLVRRRRTAA
jgi:hypothetical protein